MGSRFSYGCGTAKRPAFYSLLISTQLPGSSPVAGQSELGRQLWQQTKNECGFRLGWFFFFHLDLFSAGSSTTGDTTGACRKTLMKT